MRDAVLASELTSYSIPGALSASPRTSQSAAEAYPVAATSAIVTFPATPKPTIAFPAHREWEDVATLDLPSIVAQLTGLINRCAATRKAMGKALYELEIYTRIFLAQQPPTTPSAIAGYLNDLVKAQIAGRAIFAPQDAYRNALATLCMLAAEMIESLPKKSKDRKRLGDGLKLSLASANYHEETTREVLRGLAVETSKGKERHALLVYIDTAQSRLKKWEAEEAKFREWAEGCVLVMTALT